MSNRIQKLVEWQMKNPAMPIKSVYRALLRKAFKSSKKRFDVNRFQRIFIEPCFNVCNLRCTSCPVGQNVQLSGMSKGMMSLDLFKRIWNKSLSRYQGKIALYNWGESFLNSDLPGIVGHIKTHSSARLILNSNFSFKFDDRILEMLAYLEDDEIIISCDGFSQELCEKYRVNVDFDAVMHNVELINRHKKPHTELIWQYLRFPWNAADQAAAESYCNKREIKIHFGTGGIVPHYPILPTPQSADSDNRCTFYLRALSINFDGEVYPCCAYYGPDKYSLGNAAKAGLKEIFTRGKGKEMLDYLAFKSDGHDGLFCKHCVERNVVELESWKRPAVKAVA